MENGRMGVWQEGWGVWQERWRCGRRDVVGQKRWEWHERIGGRTAEMKAEQI